MLPNAAMSGHDRLLLFALSCQVRVVTLDQLIQWWHIGACGARTHVNRLVEANYLESRRVIARSLPPIAGPLASWHPGQSPPDPGKTSYAARRRWRHSVAHTSLVYLASQETRNLFGARGKPKVREIQATHDLGLTQTYLWFRDHRPEMADFWLGEDQFSHLLRGYKRKMPDAIIQSPDRAIRLVVEFAGAYSSSRISTFHAYWAKQRVPYELY